MITVTHLMGNDFGQLAKKMTEFFNATQIDIAETRDDTAIVSKNISYHITVGNEGNIYNAMIVLDRK